LHCATNKYLVLILSGI